MRKFNKYKFIQNYIFTAFIVVSVISLLLGIIAIITHSEFIRTIYFGFSYIVPFLAGIHIFPTYLWDDGNMAVRNRRIIIPVIIACLFLMIIAAIILG